MKKCKKIIVIILLFSIIIPLVFLIKSCFHNNNDLVKYENSKEVPKTICYDGKILKVKHFEISAISTKIVYNDYGDNDPNGLMYALSKDTEKIKEEVKNNPDKTSELVTPLVIRANVGDFIIVDFTNELDRPASIHIGEIGVDVNMSDGANVGYNENTTTNDQRRYYWYAEREGTFLFNDMSDIRSTEDATNVHGLFGALIVEPKGATWTDPKTGEELKSGPHADIHLPCQPDFREFAVIFHDEPPVVDINGNETLNHEGQVESTMPINYRAEPMRNRSVHNLPSSNTHHNELSGEEVSMSSWPFGDPDTPILKAYVGDPVRIRLIHAGIKETHVFHMHNHQWHSEINDPNSNIIDSVSFSPGQTISFDLLHGAGSLNKTPGDIIWHCHLYPHFGMGMWGLLRVHDRLEEGDRVLPDGTKTTNLCPLPDREKPEKPDELHPGYPLFLKGENGEKAEKPPLGIEGEEFREPTELEKANFKENAEPGVLYSEPFPENAPRKIFEISAIQLDIVYNNEGWHDPEGRVFVLKEDEEAVLSGNKKPEPLVLRANEGDVVEVRLTNKLPETIGGNAFQLVTETTEARIPYSFS